jgi:hypothetical protein
LQQHEKSLMVGARHRPARFEEGRTSMRRTFVAVALLSMVWFPVSHALAFTVDQQSGSSADPSSKIVDPDQQLDLFGLQQNQTEGGGALDPTSNTRNINPTLNGGTPGVTFPNPYLPLVQQRR